MTNSTWPSMILGLRRLAATVTLALPLSIFTATFFAAGAWAATQETVLYDFSAFGGAGGNTPYAGLILDAAGNFYGTTSEGGTYGQGVAFELTKVNGVWIETKLHEFGNGADGSKPYAGLVMDAAGNLYGTTSGGGNGSNCDGGCGTVFELKANDGWEEKILHNFDFGDGADPIGGVIFDSSGHLYGTTSQGGNGCTGQPGCGIVFELKIQADGDWTEKVLLEFDGGNGSSPTADLTFDAAGNLYGTTSGGRAWASGEVFELTPGAGGTWTEKVLWGFALSDGANPNSSVIFDAAGNLYGTTTYGGTYSEGTVFELEPEGDGNWTETVLHSFNDNGVDGAFPYGGLVIDGTGHLYGTTLGGGDDTGLICEPGYGGAGTVFELTHHDDWTETVLYSFQELDGACPYASLIGSSGHLYGTTEVGGGKDGGTVFELVP